MNTIYFSDKKIRISLIIDKSLLDDFDKIEKDKGYQTRQEALIDLIKREVNKK